MAIELPSKGSSLGGGLLKLFFAQFDALRAAKDR